MKKFLLAVSLTAIVWGCGGLTNMTAQWETVVACQSYASALRALVPFKSKMKAAQVAIVNEVKSVAEPICSGELGSDPKSLAGLAALRDALAKLAVVQGEVKQ